MGDALLEGIRSRLSSFHGLTAAEKRIFLASSALLPLVGLAIRLFGLARMHGRLAGARPASGNLTLAEARRLADVIDMAARHGPLPATCLTRSLLLQWFLRGRLESDLRIGVRLARGRLEAHAWVECEGLPVNDGLQVLGDFAAFDEPVSGGCARGR